VICHDSATQGCGSLAAGALASKNPRTSNKRPHRLVYSLSHKLVHMTRTRPAMADTIVGISIAIAVLSVTVAFTCLTSAVRRFPSAAFSAYSSQALSSRTSVPATPIDLRPRACVERKTSSHNLRKTNLHAKVRVSNRKYDKHHSMVETILLPRNAKTLPLTRWCYHPAPDSLPDPKLTPPY